MNYSNSSTLPESYNSLSADEIAKRTAAAKSQLKNRVLILAHNYQHDDIVRFADFTGDSLELARMSTKTDHEIIVFCGVHFMAESTDILNEGRKIVTLPSLDAGCALADMATLGALSIAWDTISKSNDTLVPVTYVNSSAEIKAFCGEHDGYTCTSGNAKKVLAYLFEQGKTVLFLPDENLGTNSATMLGIPRDKISSWDWQNRKLVEAADNPIIVWKGYCPVHTPFSVADINRLREEDPNITIIVHPECTPEVVGKADMIGSTSQIITAIETAKAGTSWAIGTEVNMVYRLRDAHPDKHIQLLKAYSCACSYMARIKPAYLLWNLESILDDTIVNRITVPKPIAQKAKIVLDRMISF